MANKSDDLTIKLIETGDIKHGMKLLDLGCGEGNVSFMLLNYVGSSGIVLGIDSNESAINRAVKKSKEIGCSNLHFQVVDLAEDFTIDISGFDAIITRRVLMYLPDPQKALTTALKYLKPNGVVLIQENNISHTPIGLASMPYHEKISGLIRKTLEQENVNSNLGLELNAILNKIGLKVEKEWAEAVLSTPDQPTQWAFLAKMMKGRMLHNNVINDVSELELESLEEKLTQERAESQRTFITDLIFCAVARKV